MFRSEQITSSRYGDIWSNKIYANSRTSPVSSAPPRHDTSAANSYTRPPVSSDWTGQPREYPTADSDRYTFNDREDDKCTISPKQSFEPGLNDEDCVSFFSSPTPTPMDPDSDGKDDSDGSEAGVVSPDPENNALTNFGPKMRFVSPAPWEAQGESYDDDGDDNISISDGFSMFSGRFGPRKYREQEKVSIRSLALASMRTPSPTPTASSRRGPYEKFNPNATQSQVSLSAREAPWASRSTLESPSSERPERPSFSFSVRDKETSSPGPLTERSLTQKTPIQQRFPLSQDDTSSIISSDSPVSLNQYPHPYANPDVIPVSASPKQPSGVETTHHQQRQSNESDPGYTRRASEPTTVATPVASTFRKGSAGNLPTSHPKVSYKPMLAKHEEAEITLLPPTLRCETNESSPTRSPQLSHSSVPFPDSPMSNLMTLEEAQRIKKASPESPIQARVRTGSTLVAGFGLQAGVDFEVRRNQLSSPLSPSDSSFTIRESKLSNARQRTISGSTKMSTATTSPSNDDLGSTKTLKHKKSGFMRLFGKDKDASTHKTDSPSTEPIPPVPKRASPPSLSVVVTSPSASYPENKIQIQQQSLSPSSQHAPPSPSPVLPSPVESDRLQDGRSLDFRPVLSAPPSQTTFEGLSLRPMSTVFSAKFSDLFSALDNPEVSLSPPVMPAASKSSGAGSPTTSDFSSRSNSSDYPITPASTSLPGAAVSIVGGRQEDAMASLQAQLTNMRKNHQREIWELESQIKDLRLENEELRNTGMCETCGKSKREGRLLKSTTSTSIVDRPRPKVSRDTRSVFGGN